VGHPSARYLLVDSVHLSVLVLDFRAHVDGHVAQVADHGADLAHVLLHFILARVFGDPVNTKTKKRHQAALVGRHSLVLLGDVSAGGSDSVTVVHHSLRLIVDHFAVFVALPRPFIFFERRTSETTQSLVKSRALIDRQRHLSAGALTSCKAERTDRSTSPFLPSSSRLPSCRH
jgi:hypothetical protein